MLSVYLPSEPARWWLMCPPPGVEWTRQMSPGRTYREKTASLATVPLIGRTSTLRAPNSVLSCCLARASISSILSVPW